MVEVTWKDACTQAGWHRFEKAESMDVPECKTVGRLVSKTKHLVKVTPTINSEGDVADTWAIPQDWITKIVTLRKGKKS